MAGHADPEFWAVARADRLAVMIDSAACFRAMLDALRQAKRRVWIVGWTFDPRTRMDPTDDTADTRIGEVLNTLARERPELEIRVLVWNASGLAHAARRLQPALARKWFRDGRVRFATDDTLPLGASMHRKLVVIDEALAFCPNDDITVNRWDDMAHLDRNPARKLPSGRGGPPWHAVHAMLDGPAAARLADVARERWNSVTGDDVAPLETPGAAWPEGVAPLLRDREVTVTGTDPSGGAGAPHAGLAHALRCIERARRSLYIEATYLTSTRLREALAARLREADGPEVVLVTGRHAPSFFDRAVMDPPRTLFLHRLRAADVHGRLTAVTPRAPAGRMVRVHAKVMIVDDRLLRMGSFNFANRSGGYDPECDVAVEAGDDTALRDLRHRLIGHFVRRDAAEVARAEASAGSIGGAIRRLDPEARRLPPLRPRPPVWRGWLARLHLGDPEGRADAWRPWRRTG